MAAECGEHVEHDVVGVGTEQLLDEGRYRRVVHARLVRVRARVRVRVRARVRARARVRGRVRARVRARVRGRVRGRVRNSKHSHSKHTWRRVAVATSRLVFQPYRSTRLWSIGALLSTNPPVVLAKRGSSSAGMSQRKP